MHPHVDGATISTCTRWSGRGARVPEVLGSWSLDVRLLFDENYHQCLEAWLS